MWNKVNKHKINTAAFHSQLIYHVHCNIAFKCYNLVTWAKSLKGCSNFPESPSQGFSDPMYINV